MIKLVKISTVMMIVFLMSGCSTVSDREYVEDIYSTLIESDKWECSDSECSLTETELWNTTTYSVVDDSFQVKLRTEIDGVYGFATLDFSKSKLTIDPTSSEEFECDIFELQNCSITGEPKEQLEVSIAAILDVIQLDSSKD